MYLPGDLRFTRNGNILYAFVMESDGSDILITSIPDENTVSSVKMLGSKEIIKWENTSKGLQIKRSNKYPDFRTIVYKIILEK